MMFQTGNFLFVRFVSKNGCVFGDGSKFFLDDGKCFFKLKIYPQENLHDNGNITT